MFAQLGPYEIIVGSVGESKIVWHKNSPAGPEFCQTRQNLAVCHRTLALTRLEGIIPCKTILIIGPVLVFS